MTRTLRVEPDHLLSRDVAARCFWWPRCQHTVTDAPMAAHDAMERHYAVTHRDDLARIVGWRR